MDPPARSAAARRGQLELPSDLTLERDLGLRRGVRVVRARRGTERLYVRLDADARAGEARAELAVLAQVQHPGIAALVEHRSLPAGGLLVAREWVPGEDLATWAHQREAAEVAAVVAALTPALDYLHARGFVHGDLTAANVLVTADGRPLLCDFGFARALDGSDRSEAIQGSLFGLAPELLFGQAPTVQSDLFALGALLHALLVERTVTARAFYGRFPRASFLDALDSSPEDLPVWARDLVVSLTARDPSRRPASAATVGRLLAARLGVDAQVDLRTPPRVPVLLGREAWSAALIDREVVPFVRDGAERARTWWAVAPPDESIAALATALQLASSLCGAPASLLDIDAHLEGIDSSARLEEWARERLEEGAGCLVVSVGSTRTWVERAVYALVRTRDLVAASVPLLIVAAWEPDEKELQGVELRPVPAVGAGDVLRLVESSFPHEAPERRAAFAAALAAGLDGSAARLERALASLFESGQVLGVEAGYRLLPGFVPDENFVRTLARPRQASCEGLAPPLRQLVARLVVAGGAAPVRALRDLDGEVLDGDVLDAEAAMAGVEVLQLVEAGAARLRQTRAGLELVLAPDVGCAPAAPEVAQAHAWRADQLAADGAPAHEVCVHRVAATGARADAEHLRAACDRLRSSGSAELALDRISAALRFLAPAVDAGETSQLLEVERARTWAELGHHDRALQALRDGDYATPELEGRALLVRAQVARSREDVAEAFALLRRAASLTPAAASEAAVLRVQHLHSLGRDADVRRDVAELLTEPEAAQDPHPELTHRQRIYLASIDAVSAYRLGSVEEALDQTERLLGDSRREGDRAREAALLLNRATIARRAGRTQAAEEALARAVPLFEELGDAAGLAHALVTRAQFQRDAGELLSAEAALERALRLRTVLGDREGAATVRGTMALVACERGHARAAIESLRESRAAFSGAHRERFLPLLRARELELRRRIGDPGLPSDCPDPRTLDEVPDPRVLLALARAAVFEGERSRAIALAERARDLAASLKLGPNEADACSLLFALGELVAPGFERAADRLTLDRLEVHGLLREPPDTFRADEALRMADELRARGSDDLAARLYFALGARAPARRDQASPGAAGEACLARCAAGLTATEAAQLRQNLLGLVDPWPADLVQRSIQADASERIGERVLELLSINRLLLSQSDLTGLLGTIVEKALQVTGAERGFVMLEEEGVLRQETALDSLRGDMPEPEREFSRSVVQEALEGMEPICVSNAVDDPLLGGSLSVIALELRSILCVPFQVEEHLRGVVYLDHRLRRGVFEGDAERFCVLFADQAALAIQQVRRRERILELNRALEEKLVVQREHLLESVQAAGSRQANPVAEALVGSSDAMADVRRLVERVAQSDLSVLFTGASGTGKDVAARALHEASARAAGPFVSENCAALPDALVESELFGHERGAFTGADSARPGLIERASGGTLFLDEIGDMPRAVQAKLLRALETHSIRRVGSEDRIDVDFRLAAATNRDLEADVQSGRFRADLLFRLDGLRIRMPSLQERTQDIPELIRHFLALEAAHRGESTTLTHAVAARLCQREWPGNVRELRNEIARLCVLSPGLVADPELVRMPAAASAAGAEVLPLAEAERRCILAALEHCGGDKTRAAQLLGVSRGKIYAKLRQYARQEQATEES